MTTAATNLNSGNYADTTGSGAGWNGTIALQQFVNTQAWVPTGSALANNNSPVTRATPRTPTTRCRDLGWRHHRGGVWTGTESGSGTATKNAAFAVGTKGITITFATGTTYLASDRYNIRADVLATTAMTMATGGSCTATGTTATGTNIPAMINTSSTVTGGTYNTYGTAIKVISAPVGQGLGTFTCTPKSTLSVDSNFAPRLVHRQRPVQIATGP